MSYTIGLGTHNRHKFANGHRVSWSGNLGYLRLPANDRWTRVPVNGEIARKYQRSQDVVPLWVRDPHDFGALKVLPAELELSGDCIEWAFDAESFLIGHMGVDRGSGNVGMPEKTLDVSQIGRGFKQVCPEGVP